VIGGGTNHPVDPSDVAEKEEALRSQRGCGRGRDGVLGKRASTLYVAHGKQG
jgi:hypothetical protein